MVVSKEKLTAVSIGQKAELIAAKYLTQQGLRIVQTNYRCKMGEIDLIGRDFSHIVFVEVRYRRSNRFGGALESISSQKCYRLERAAAHFLNYHPWTKLLFSLFDVVAISPKNDGRIDKICTDSMNIHWIKNAFSCE